MTKPTLPLTQQEAFDISLSHMRKQGTFAHGTLLLNGISGCLYRGPTGTKCAIGAHITDAEYSSAMEGNDAESLKQDYSIAALADLDGMFLNDIQSTLHDNLQTFGEASLLFNLEHYAKEFAARWDLIYTPPEPTP